MLKFLPLFLVGCGIVAGPLPEDPTGQRDPRCARLDQAHADWTTVAVVGGAVSTATSAAIPIVDAFVDPQDSNDWNLGLGLFSIVGGGMTMLGTFMAGEAGQEWESLGCGSGP